MWPEPRAAAEDGERVADEELGRKGGGGGKKEREREGEMKDGEPWPPPH